MVHLLRPNRLARPQAAVSRGAASLVVVMILFFIITLVAAYTSRNLLFEQRTSANQYRATVAFEAADAGIEWAIARLNEGVMNVVNDDCTQLDPATAVGAQPSFRQRYLSVDPTTGVITTPDKLAGCVFNGTTWVCHCPDDGTNPAPTYTTTGSGPFPAFWVKFRSNQVGSRPGIVRIQVNACTRDDAACLSFTREAQSGDGLATVWSMVSLRSALPTAPTAALTAGGPVTRDDGEPTVTNTDVDSGGLTIHSGSSITNAPQVTLNSIPGTPPARSKSPDAADLVYNNMTLVPATPANTGTNRLFNSFFGSWPVTYLAQPGVAVVDCTGGCNAAAVNAAVARFPGHAIHLSGAGTLEVGANIGTSAAPVLIIADGNVVFDGGTPTVFGVIYSRNGTWNLEGDGTIQGAAIAQGAFDFEDDQQSIVYDRGVIQRIQFLTGSFVKVAGSWRDFQPGINP